ncbi:hypothetical protein [Nocardia niwae]|uniref:Uncharacterized protein n=1 Tax=Nocardia niwae TaxID=626084 RepID=A0ABV2XIM2_9NOCA|nr:hypothetical protein [Nocardia niwae]
MIRQLANWFAEDLTNRKFSELDIPRLATEEVFKLHPEQLLRFFEESWAYGKSGRPVFQLPSGLLYGAIPGLESGIRDLLPGITKTFFGPIQITRGPATDSGTGGRWDHLIYAYLIENTRLIDIFRRVVTEYLQGERLEVPSSLTHLWLRTTESLFFRDLPSSSIAAITSRIRPDPEATRRNAYYRMFGVDLNHGTDGASSYPYHRPTASNTGFIEIFEDFLREVWLASENYKNTSGINTKDDAAIATSARDMQDMLTTRRRLGNLAREEFAIVSMLSWFHLTVESDNCVVTDLKANAGSPEERLRKIGERVGLAPHTKSESFFRLAPAMSTLLSRIELGDFNTSSTVSVLYADPETGPPNIVRTEMLDIINQWSTATGRDMKARRTTVTPRTNVPAARPKASPPRAPVATGDGSRTG